MALSERIFSLETEYGIQFYPDQDIAVSPSAVVPRLIEVVAHEYGVSYFPFLANGSKLHYDVGHPEWSLPECRTAHEAAVYDKAADHLLRVAIPEAEQRLAASGFSGHLFVFKNNVDSSGNTFGCHENYLMQKNARLLGGEPFLRYLVRCLVPFLVTRQLLCGAGLLRFDGNGRVFYQLSQRSDYIEAVVSAETQLNRAIVNIGREEQSLSPSENRRLHLIVGDSNISGWSTWIKLGTTGLLLRLIEDLYLNDIPVIADPVGALQTISRDMTRSETILLRDGTSVQALDIQWQYYEAVNDYVDQFGMSDEEEALLAAWGDALEALGDEDDPLLLRDRADWAIKKKLIDAKLQNLGYSWEDSMLDQESIAALRAIDMRFHDVSEQGYYSRLWTDDTLVTDAEIQQAKSNAPAYTRANIRGKAIVSEMSGDLDVFAERWTDLIVDDVTLNLRDPLQFVHPFVPDTCSEAELRSALTSSDAGVMQRAVEYLGRLGGQKNLQILAEVINNNEDEFVRRAAIKAVGQIEDCDNISVLLECLSTRDVHARWAVEEALKQVGRPGVEDPWNDNSAASSDDDEPLVNLT